MRTKKVNIEKIIYSILYIFAIKVNKKLRPAWAYTTPASRSLKKVLAARIGKSQFITKVVCW